MRRTQQIKIMNTPPDTCPHCGGDRVDGISQKSKPHFVKYYCGSQSDNWLDAVIRTSLCKEREDRQKTKAELEKVIEQKNKIIDILDGAIYDLHCFGYPIAARRYRLSLNTLEGK